MTTASHPQILIALNRRSPTAEVDSGYPPRIPTRPGFRTPEPIVAPLAANAPPPGLGEDRGDNPFGGI